MIVEHLCKYTKYGSFVFIAEAFNINVEKNGFRLTLCSTVNQHKGCRIIFKLFPETLYTTNALNCFVLQKIREHFQKVRFTTSKETRNPNAHIGGWLLKGIAIVIEKGNEMLLQFLGDNILI